MIPSIDMSPMLKKGPEEWVQRCKRNGPQLTEMGTLVWIHLRILYLQILLNAPRLQK